VLDGAQSSTPLFLPTPFIRRLVLVLAFSQPEGDTFSHKGRRKKRWRIAGVIIGSNHLVFGMSPNKYLRYD